VGTVIKKYISVLTVTGETSIVGKLAVSSSVRKSTENQIGEAGNILCVRKKLLNGNNDTVKISKNGN